MIKCGYDVGEAMVCVREEGHDGPCRSRDGKSTWVRRRSPCPAVYNGAKCMLLEGHAAPCDFGLAKPGTTKPILVCGHEYRGPHGCTTERCGYYGTAQPEPAPVRPEYYKPGSPGEPWAIMEAHGILRAFLIGDIIKRLLRPGKGEWKLDLQKIRTEVDKLIELEEKANAEGDTDGESDKA